MVTAKEQRQRTKKSYPMLPRQLRHHLQSQAGAIGVRALAAKLHLTEGWLYRILGDGNARVRQSSIELITRRLEGRPQQEDGQPTSAGGDFTLRLTMGIKKAERLVAHCDLNGITPSAFVTDLVEKKLDELWGPEPK